MAHLSVGCFGKLPFWPEYLEARVNFETSNGLKQWLHLGREDARMADESGGGKDAERSTPLRILLSMSGSPDLLAAVLRPSKGRGGRHFPFAVFVHFPRKAYGKHFPLIPMALSGVWEELEDAWEALASLASHDAFTEMLQSLEVQPPTPLRDVRNAYEAQMREQASGLFEGGDGESLATLVSSMPDVIGRLKQKGNGGTALQLPVAGDLTDACFDASVWIDLFNRQFRLRRLDPCVFVDAGTDGSSRKAVLKFGPLVPSDYAGVMGLGGTAEAPLRPAHQAGAEGENDGGAGESLTYAELLGRRF
jgi:type VI secretion system ImpM family protein